MSIPPEIYYVYSLIDPRNGSPFYIGKGKGERSQVHLRAVIGGYHCNPKLSNKIKKIVKKGLVYEVEFLFSSYDEQECLEKEIFYIKYFGRKSLCNLTDGGDNPPRFTKATHPEIIAAISARVTEWHSRPEVKIMRSKSLRRSHSNPNVRAAISKGLRETMGTPEFKEKRSQSMIERWTNPEYQEKMSIRRFEMHAARSPELQAEISAKMWETRRAMGNGNPQQRSDASRKGHITRRQNKIKSLEIPEKL